MWYNATKRIEIMKKILLIIFLNFLLSVSVMAQEECPVDRPVMWVDNACHTCDEAKELLANAPMKGKIEGLEALIVMAAIATYDETCVSVDECPTDKPAKWIDGQCYACAEIESKVGEMEQNGQQPNLNLFAVSMANSEACPELIKVNIH